MKQNKTQKEFERVVKDLTELRRKKNLAYGNGFMKNYNLYGNKALFFDLLRKWQRMESLLYEENTNEVTDETIYDTLGDMAVMCINAMVWMENK